MPKMKTNRLARKKYRVSGNGLVKKARAGTSHNSGKKPSKRIRQLRGRNTVHSTNEREVRRLLPHSK